MPKTLADEAQRLRRREALSAPHVAALTGYVSAIRQQVGPAYKIPDFDPEDGGVNARCLFLLEAPGPRAIETGFVSRDNPDETAKNFHLLCQEVGLDRSLCVVWNVVPWYVGSGGRIRPVNAGDLHQARPHLAALLRLLPQLQVVVLMGAKAASAASLVKPLSPDLRLATMRHPSPLFVNRAPENRAKLLSALAGVAAQLARPTD